MADKRPPTGSGQPYPGANTWYDLPDPNEHDLETYLVYQTSGSWYNFTKHKAGLYRSAVGVWRYQGVEVDISTTQELDDGTSTSVSRFTIADIVYLIVTHAVKSSPFKKKLEQYMCSTLEWYEYQEPSLVTTGAWEDASITIIDGITLMVNCGVLLPDVGSPMFANREIQDGDILRIYDGIGNYWDVRILTVDRLQTALSYLILHLDIDYIYLNYDPIADTGKAVNIGAFIDVAPKDLTRRQNLGILWEKSSTLPTNLTDTYIKTDDDRHLRLDTQNLIVSDASNVNVKHFNPQFPVGGGDFTLAHGLPLGVEVTGFTIGFTYSGDGSDGRLFMTPGFTDSLNFEYQAYISSGSIIIRDISASSLYGMPGSATIMYK